MVLNGLPSVSDSCDDIHSALAAIPTAVSVLADMESLRTLKLQTSITLPDSVIGRHLP